MVSETLDRNSLNISKAPSENSNTTGIPLNVEYSKIVAHSVKTEPSIITENPKPVKNFNSLNSEVSSPSEGVTVREKRSSDPLTISAPMPPKRTSREPPLARPRLRATETLENDVQETIDFGEENVELFKKVRIIPKSVRPQEVNVNGVEPAVQTSVSEKETKDAEVVVNKVPEIILTDSEDKLFEPRGNKTSVNIAELVSDFSDDDDIDPIDIILIESKSAAPKSEPTPISNGMLPPPSVDIRNSPKASVSFKPDIETISNSSYSSLEEFVQSSSEFYVDLPRNDAQTPSQLKSILKPDDKESLEEEYEDDMFNSWVRVDKHRKQLDNWQHSKLPPPLPKTPPPTLEEEYIFDDSPLPVRSRESLI